MSDERLTARETVRLSETEAARLRELVRRIPHAKRSSLVRALLVRGLDAVERDPTTLIRPAELAGKEGNPAA